LYILNSMLLLNALFLKVLFVMFVLFTLMV